MGEVFRLLLFLFPAIGVGVGILYHRTLVLALAVIRAGMVLSGAIVMNLLLTGILNSGLHRYAGHAFVILVWLLAPAAIGVSVGEAIRSHRWWRLTHVLLPIMLLGFGVFAAVTGYLRQVPTASDPQQLRFIVLHMTVMPILLGIVLASWFLLSRPYAREGAQHAAGADR